MKKIAILFLILLLESCSSYSQFFHKKGHFTIGGGRYNNLTWKNDLIFERNSWYREFNLYFESFSVVLDKKSPFYHWLSVREKSSLENCPHPGLLVYFSSDNNLTSEPEFIDQIRTQGAEIIKSNTIKKYIISHPSSTNLGLVDYKFDLICNKVKKSSYIIDFANFKEQVINF